MRRMHCAGQLFQFPVILQKERGDLPFILFLCHARRSVLELETQALIAQKLLGCLVKDDEGKIRWLTAEVGKLLNTLIDSLNHAAA
jgi:hypothetical protein